MLIIVNGQSLQAPDNQPVTYEHVVHLACAAARKPHQPRTDVVYTVQFSGVLVGTGELLPRDVAAQSQKANSVMPTPGLRFTVNSVPINRVVVNGIVHEIVGLAYAGFLDIVQAACAPDRPAPNVAYVVSWRNKAGGTGALAPNQKMELVDGLVFTVGVAT